MFQSSCSAFLHLQGLRELEPQTGTWGHSLDGPVWAWQQTILNLKGSAWHMCLLLLHAKACGCCWFVPMIALQISSLASQLVLTFDPLHPHVHFYCGHSREREAQRFRHWQWHALARRWHSLGAFIFSWLELVPWSAQPPEGGKAHWEENEQSMSLNVSKV